MRVEIRYLQQWADMLDSVTLVRLDERGEATDRLVLDPHDAQDVASKILGRDSIRVQDVMHTARVNTCSTLKWRMDELEHLMGDKSQDYDVRDVLDDIRQMLDILGSVV